jgi:hypothetical protein
LSLNPDVNLSQGSWHQEIRDRERTEARGWELLGLEREPVCVGNWARSREGEEEKF